MILIFLVLLPISIAALIPATSFVKITPVPVEDKTYNRTAALISRLNKLEEVLYGKQRIFPKDELRRLIRGYKRKVKKPHKPKASSSATQKRSPLATSKHKVPTGKSVIQKPFTPSLFGNARPNALYDLRMYTNYKKIWGEMEEWYRQNTEGLMV